MKVDNIKPRVDPFVFLFRHGVASDGLQSLGCATGLLSLEMSRSSSYRARGLQVQCRADHRVLGLSVRRMFLRLSAPRATKFTLFFDFFLFPSRWSDHSSGIRSSSVVVKVSLSPRSASGCH